MQTQSAAYDAPGSESWVTRHYGALVSTAHLAQLLGFPSAPAVRRAANEGRLPIQLKAYAGRRGVFATAGEVAAYLEQLKPDARRSPP